MDRAYRSDSDPSLVDNISSGDWELALEYLNKKIGMVLLYRGVPFTRCFK